MDAAIVTIDLHRGHLDPAVATLPVPPERARALLAAMVPWLAACRDLGVPILHVVTAYRNGAEAMSNPFWQQADRDPTASRQQMGRHNLLDSVGTQLMPGVAAPPDRVILGKKRYDAFLGTDLEFLLRQVLQARRLYLVGVNTNSCVLATAIRANTLDFDVAVVREGVTTMDALDLHQAALDIVATAFGRVIGAGQALAEFGRPA